MFDCVYCRNMYDELTQNENASQYEDILKKGSTQILIEVIFLKIKLNSSFFSPCL